jgi:hypothetical protein
LSDAGHAPGMSGFDDTLPALDEQTRQLIASMIQTGIQPALAGPTIPSRRETASPLPGWTFSSTPTPAPTAMLRRSARERVVPRRFGLEEEAVRGTSIVPQRQMKTTQEAERPKTRKRGRRHRWPPGLQRGVIRNPAWVTYRSAFLHPLAHSPLLLHRVPPRIV